MVGRVLRATGKTLIGAGVLVLLFVAYQVWGTGLRTARAQDRLDNEFRRRLAVVATTVITPATPPSAPTQAVTVPASTVPALPDDERPAPGEAAGRIAISAIDIDWVFVEGVSVADLKKGPGHYPETPMPGQAGNAAIAGHRTTYGAPFNRIDELAPGDDILISTVQGRFRYRVTEQFIVDPSRVEVLLPVPGKNTLTLTSCHPKYSARQRIIVRADLVGEPAPSVPATATSAVRATERKVTLRAPSLSGETVARWPTLLWGAAAAAVGVAAWRLALRWRRRFTYALAVVPLLVALFQFFENVSRLLPANY